MGGDIKLLMLMVAAVTPLFASVPIRPALLQHAEVQGNVIRLADLLAVSAPQDLKASAEKIELGRAPQPGTTRVLEGDQIARRLSAYSDLPDFLIAPQVTVTRAGWPLNETSIWNAVARFLTDRGWKQDEVPGRDVLRWPSGIRSATDNPKLEITHLGSNLTEQRLQFRARCVDPSACGTFLIEAIVPSGSVKSWRSTMNSTAAKSAIRTHAYPSTRGVVHELVPAASGKRALLILESQGVRVSLPVVCLQRGTLGQTIRVREWGGHRIYRAEVVGTALLRAGF